MRRDYFEAFRKIDTLSSEFGLEVRWAGRTYYPPNFEMSRVHKRYLLLYVFNGECLAKDENKKTCVLEQGNILFFPPGKQQYKSYNDKPLQCYGLSFSGRVIDSILERMPVKKKKTHYIGIQENLLNHFHDLINEMISRPSSQSYIIWGAFFRVLDEINSAITRADWSQNHEGIKENRIARAAQFIRLNYNRSLAVNNIAEVAGYSISWFEKLFRDYYHMSPIQYQMKQRIERAEEMIRIDVLNISEISRAVGFYDAFYFSRVFKKLMGVSPSHYRETCLRSQEVIEK